MTAPTLIPNPFLPDSPDSSAYVPLPAPVIGPAASVDMSVIDRKRAELRAANAEKIDELRKFNQTLTAQTDLYDQRKATEANSWVGKVGADPKGIFGTLLNGAANVATGTSRLAGDVLALPFTAVTMMNEGNLSQEDTDAYNRYVTGKATTADMARLNTKVNQGVNAKSGGATPAMTVLDSIKQAEGTRQVSQNIDKFFDISSIEHGGRKQELNQDLGASFRDAATKIIQGWDSSKKGQYGAAAKDLASGIAGLLLNAGDAAITHPGAVAEYVAENAPQLLIGGMGKAGSMLEFAGKGGLVTSNLGYAADYYQQGIEKFKSENNGQLPSNQDRAAIAAWASSLAVAEHLGDHVGLAAMKVIKPAVKEGEQAAVEGLRASLKAALNGNALSRTAVAGLEGAIGETATEGYQTYAEGQASGKPASGEDIYTGAVIGGLSGGILSGGVHGVAEMAGATPEKAAERAAKANKAEVFKAAVASNDPSAFLNPEGGTYDPAMAIGAMFQHNQTDAATPESRIENFQKATQVMDDLANRSDELKAQIKSGTPEEVNAAKAELKQLEHHTQLSQVVWNKMFDELNKSLNNTDTAEQVKQANVPVQQADEATATQVQQAKDNVINLSMASRTHLTPDQAAELASNTANGLSEDERSFLRVFSAARQQENLASNLGKVSREIIEGTKKNIGLADYRQRIGMALASNNQAMAEKQLKMLNAFATSHAEKAAVAQEAYDKYGEEGQVYKTDSGWGYAAPGTYSAGKLRAGGGLPMIKQAILNAVKEEAKAIATTRDEMTQAMTLKFGPAVQNVDAGVQSAPSTQASPAAQPAATPTPSQNEGQEKNNYPQGNGKDEARLESGTPEAVAEAPHSSYKETTPVSETAASPASEPSAPIAVADAPAQGTAPSLASAETQTTEEQTQQVATEQQAEAVAEAPAAQVAPAVEAIAEKAGKDAPYVQRKLGDFFNQIGVGATPLASVKDFISSITKVDDFAQYVSDITTEEQAAALRKFWEQAKAWQVAITSNIVNRNKPQYNYEDAMQYFIRPDGDIEENVKTAIAYAVFSYVTENFGRKGINTTEEMNQLIGRGKDTFVNNDERALLQNLMASMPAVVDALGQRVVKALGLQLKADAPVNELSRLQAGLGAHALRLLTDGENPLVTMRFIAPADLQAMRNRSKKTVDVDGLDTNESGTGEDAVFIEITRDEQGNPTPLAQEIVNTNRGSKSVVNTLFSIEDAARPPTFEPVTKLRKYAKRTQQLVPTFLQRILKQLNKQENFIRGDKLEILDVLGDERFLAMMGVTPVDNTIHVANRKALDAKNEGLRRELTNIKEFIKNYLGRENIDQPFFFEHYAMKQQRVGIANSMVNPQASKIHRFMVYRQSWITEVDMANREQLENFVLRAAEGLGVKTDKNDRATALQEFRDKYNLPEIQAGIAALNKIRDGATLTESEMDTIVTAVAKGGENAHSLDALVALAEYARAQKLGDTQFKVNMLAEVDGVTNGPMLSHLLMGAAGSVNDLFKLLNRGGFYKTPDTQFNDWRSTAGNLDLYETTTRNVLDRLAWMQQAPEVFTPNDRMVLQHVMHFMGKLQDSATGAILKDGRNMIKTPLTAMVYGSGIKTAIADMASDFISNIYGRIEKANELQAKPETEAAARQMHKETVAALNALGMAVPADVGISDMMELQFSRKEEDLLVHHFMSTLGKAVEETIRDDFKVLLDNRQKFNATASMTFDLYNAAYEGLRNQLIEELVQKGEIAATSKGTPLHDLTPAQEKILDERLAKITPVLQTAMSNLSGEPTAHTGMLVADSELKPEKTLAYKNVVHFAKGFKQIRKRATESLIVYGRRIKNSDPGVGLGATSTHSFDSAVSHSALAGHEVLNLHDAHGTGIHDLVAAGRRLNKAVWDRAMEYSPATEMYNSLMRTVRGMESLLKDSTTPDEVKALLAKNLVEQSKKSSKYDPELGRKTAPIPPQTILMTRAIEAMRLAYDAARIQYGAMAEMHSIAQYAVEGGHYAVTDQDRAAARAKLERLTQGMPEQDIKSVQFVIDQLRDHIEGAVLDTKYQSTRVIKTSDLGTLGKSRVTSDVALVNFFRKTPNASLNQVAAFLKSRNLTGFQQKLLASLVKALGDRAAGYRVRFLTKESQLGDVLELPNGPSHAWFVSKDGKNEIYVLSPDFKESGLTIETLLHEMTHAAVAHAIANPTPETQPLIDELENLRQIAQQLVYENKLMDLIPAVESVQELVAWGMTNPALQALLDSHLMESKNGGNKWITGLKAFIDSLIGLLFGKQNDSASTGMTVLVTNVSGLMAASAASPASKGYINQSMAAPLASLSGEAMYDELGKLGHTQLKPEFDAKLRALLNRMEESVHSPLAAMKQAAQAAAAQTPYDLWTAAKNAGVAPFGKSALASGFRFSEQEAFALEQVEATVRTALEDKDGSATPVYRELARLYNEARDHFKGRVNDLHPDQKQAQALYDFIFKMETGNGNRSDYLSRFAALGLANQQFNQLLQFSTKIAPSPLAGQTFADKLHAIFERVMEFINNKMTNTYGGQKADAKLAALVDQLVDIEQRKRMKIAQSASVVMDTFEQLFRDGVSKGRQGLQALGNSRFFKNSSNGVVRFTGAITATVAGGRVDDFLNGLQTFRDQYLNERNGVMMGIVNETRGAHSGNSMFYKLLRLAKRSEGVRKDLITNTANFVMSGFKDGGKYLTDDMKAAMSTVLLRTDLASLLDAKFDMAKIAQLIIDRKALDAAINDFETRLKPFAHALSYQNGAKALALYLATGEVGAANLRFNAENIANMLGTAQANKVAPDEATAAAAVIDPLVTLYALTYVHDHHLTEVQKVLAEETGRTDDGNGIEMVLKMHQQLQKDSKERLFKSSGTLRMKGYTPEIYNPYIRLQVADSVTKGQDGKTEGERLEEYGYSQGAILTMDDADPGKTAGMRIYKLRDGGLVQYLTGIFSYTGQRRRGTSTHNGDLGLLSVTGLMNRNKMTQIENGQQRNIAQQANGIIDPLDASKKKNFLVPVFNSQGEVVNYRYMMNHATKDGLLERDNRFEQLLGAMAGNIFDKETTAKQNREAVQALRDQYLQDFAKNPGSYLEVGPHSKDDEAREVWNLLPEETRQAVRDIWGTNHMMVRYDLLDINFGYRKLSAAAPFGIPESERGHFEQAWVQLMEGMFGKKAGLYVRRTEDIWQALVREAKDTMVVKSGLTLLGNFTSNISELIWFGVPMTDIWRHHRVALKGILAYRKDSKELDALEQRIKLDHLAGQDRKEVERRIIQLRDALARNPVRELVEAGLMPTIVEDVSQDDDRYSYKGQFTRKVDEFVSNLNPHVLQAGKYLVMAHDTPLYKAMSYGTQVSDFIARYTLYQHVINRAKNPMDAQTAVQLVSDAFVNYDVPSHRSMQYANDIGFVYFSKYYLRIQKVIALLYQQNPGRAMMLLTLGHFLDFIPMLTHSAMIHRIGNPFRMGAFEAVSTLDEMMTLNSLMSPFR